MDEPSTVFEDARREFLKGMPEKEQHDILRFGSIAAVYDETDRIQQNQGTNNTLRNMRKIEPLIDLLKRYEKIVEVFMGVQPGIIPLIWVCKFVLLSSSWSR